MPACEGCGANVDPRAELCAYCKQTTPYGVHMRDYRAHQEVAAQHHRWAFWHHARMQGVGQAQRTASRALIAALLGVVPCFCCIPSVVAIVMALRARSEARRYDEPMPGTAVVSLFLAAVVLAIFSTAMILAQVERAERDKRIAALRKDVAGQLEEEKIKLGAACKLAEIKLLEGGYEGGTRLENVDCAPAKLDQQGEYLALADVRVKLPATTEMLTFCMKKRERWSVERVVPSTSRCNSAPAASAAPTSTEHEPPRRAAEGSAGERSAPTAPASVAPSGGAGRGRRR